VVSDTGAVNRGDNVTSASRVGTGDYQVTTSLDVTGCAYYATVGTTGTLSPGDTEGGYAVVGQTPGNSHKVTILTYRAQSVLDDYGFHLAVVC
jgi:hypothetical protein